MLDLVNPHEIEKSEFLAVAQVKGYPTYSQNLVKSVTSNK
jgi:hypothetical protein